jgi:hypothetical protein
VAALCVASFVVGLLLSGRVSLLPSASASSKVKATSDGSGCDDNRVSVYARSSIEAKLSIILDVHIYFCVLLASHARSQI